MADSSELGQYQFQLEQVEDALSRDPSNKELQKLQSDLRELISLFETAAEATSAQSTSQSSSSNKKANGSSASSKRKGGWDDESPSHQQQQQQQQADPDAGNGEGDSPDEEEIDEASLIAQARWIKGQTVLAKYKDNKLYEAIIESVPVAGNPFYTVTFKGYTTKTKTPITDIRDFDPTQVAKPASAVTGGVINKKKATPKAYAMAFKNGEDRRSKKMKRNLEYQEHLKTIETEHQKKQSSWLKFASGGKKNAIVKGAPPLKKKSMFATPDDPNAKVGVMNSGKGVTQFQQRSKHIYERTD
ncbi:hypothetical protein HDU76_005011 [Blyttiomyces sp. JEL0837]|nr:hypothetical protein HDU76_005011 [Blyttiomyces sp. JEL0837]